MLAAIYRPLAAGVPPSKRKSSDGIRQRNDKRDYEPHPPLPLPDQALFLLLSSPLLLPLSPSLSPFRSVAKIYNSFVFLPESPTQKRKERKLGTPRAMQL